MRKSALSWALAAALVFAGACHKNTSTSSSSGSLVGALNDLALVALNSVHGNSGFPTIGPGCSPAPNLTGNFATGGLPPQSTCPSTSYTPDQTYISSTINLTFDNCSYQGYVFNGSLSFGVGSTSLSECTLKSNPADVYLAGSYALNINSSSFTISGNGLSASCDSGGGTYGPISLTASGVSYETVPSPSTLVGILNGQGCQTKISNLKFFWQ
jgi:hypothetical protein